MAPRLGERPSITAWLTAYQCSAPCPCNAGLRVLDRVYSGLREKEREFVAALGRRGARQLGAVSGDNATQEDGR